MHLNRVALFTGLLLIGSMSTSMASVYDVTPEISVIGWNRLGELAQSYIKSYFKQTPRAMTPWLRVITVDNTPIPEPYASEECWPNGEFLSHRPCGFNIWSSLVGGENPFPADAPESVWVNLFVAVVNHEYGHQIGHGTDIEQSWVDSLIAEAGDDSQHYLRSMLPAGYFRQNPQEFIASMWNQWGTCSHCTLKLALARWDQGNPHPLNQLILLLALSGFRHGFLNDNGIGTVLAHRMQNGMPVSEFWSVWPWRCGGSSIITGETFLTAITTDGMCHILSVDKREGI